VIRSEDLAKDVPGTLELVWDFLELPHILCHPDIVNKAFNTGQQNGINNSQDLDMSLGHSYEPMTDKSRKMLCTSMDYWSVLSHFVNSYQLHVGQYDLAACPYPL
jgi:hypothetical protein